MTTAKELAAWISPAGTHSLAWCKDAADMLVLQAEEIERLKAERDALRKDAKNWRNDWARWARMRDWLVRYQLLHHEQCQPEAGLKAGKYWVFRRPAVIDGTHVEGWATTADACIDAALNPTGEQP